MSEEQTAIVKQEDAPEPETPRAALLKYGKNGVEFGTVKEALGYATACRRSGLMADGIKTPEQAFMIMDRGRSLGLDPQAAWNLLYVTKQNRVTLMSRGALAVAQASPRYESYSERIEFEGTENMRAVAVAKAKGSPAVEKTFSLADAKVAGLLERRRNFKGEEYDGPWQAFTKDMLQARARDRALNIAFAAELAGIELESIAEDADRLEGAARGHTITAVGAPDEPAVEPRALAAPSNDPLLAAVLKKSGAPVKLPEPAPQNVSPVLAPEDPRASRMPAVTPQQQAEIDKSVDEALPKDPPPAEPALKGRKGKPKKERAVHKVGDIVRDGTRRVVEVDDDGHILVIEKLSDEETADYYRGIKEKLVEPPKEKRDPTQPPYPAYKGEDGAWYCMAHNAYGCNPCGNIASEEKLGPGKKCPRCEKPLNLLNDCESCGWPAARRLD